MKHTYVIGIDGRGIDEAIKGVQEWKDWLQRKTDELARRLADLGAVSASLGFARAIYTGPKEFTISVEAKGNSVYAVKANGESVLFIEFGSGVKDGFGYPPEELNGYGPGTYPGVGHWDDPRGWYLPKDRWATDGTRHTYGNPPNMPMYNAVKELEQELEKIVQEVFAN